MYLYGLVWTKQTFPICFCIPIICFNWHFNCSNVLQVTNYEMVVNLFQTSHNLTWYSASVHKFTSIYPVCSTYELTKQFMQICVKNCAIDLKKNNLYIRLEPLVANWKRILFQIFFFELPCPSDINFSFANLRLLLISSYCSITFKNQCIFDAVYIV